jgi:Tfp pilus assembly protein PilX
VNDLEWLAILVVAIVVVVFQESRRRALAATLQQQRAAMQAANTRIRELEHTVAESILKLHGANAERESLWTELGDLQKQLQDTGERRYQPAGPGS